MKRNLTCLRPALLWCKALETLWRRSGDALETLWRRSGVRPGVRLWYMETLWCKALETLWCKALETLWCKALVYGDALLQHQFEYNNLPVLFYEPSELQSCWLISEVQVDYEMKRWGVAPLCDIK